MPLKASPKPKQNLVPTPVPAPEQKQESDFDKEAARLSILFNDLKKEIQRAIVQQVQQVSEPNMLSAVILDHH